MRGFASGATFIKPFCKRGHDKRVVGVDKARRCRQCKRERDARYEERRKPYHFIEPICAQGHDKRIVGVRKNGSCAECHRIHNRRWRQARTRANPESPTKAVAMPRLRVVRRSLGLSAGELAELTGYSKSHIYKIESGIYRARPKVARKIIGAIAPRLSERKWEERGI